jgi:hypothetical protein
MSALGLTKCDKVDVTSNFIPCKCRLKIILEEIEIWEHIEKEIGAPSNPKLLSLQVEKKAKEKRIILDSVKKHLIAHII